jgi:lipoprotein-anchoring transpeptidase ErfK/SrfK
VYCGGVRKGTFPVAVGRPGLTTPTGFFFVNQKLRPSSPGGAYGVLALGTSAFQPKLAYWPQGGPVAIHGTNEDYLIGKAVSHGCVRMHNKDVLRVSRLVPAGSPVVIQK